MFPVSMIFKGGILSLVNSLIYTEVEQKRRNIKICSYPSESEKNIDIHQIAK